MQTDQPAVTGPVLSERLGAHAKSKDWGRCRKALELRRDGMTLAKIAVEMGVSQERARQMVLSGESRERALENAHSNPLDLLSVRAHNCLKAENVSTPAQARALQKSGELKKVPNLGKKSVLEIEAWLNAMGA